MSRIKVIALAAMLALGSSSFTTEASARGGHGGGHWGGGHWGGGHWGGHWGGFGFHRGFGRWGWGYGYYPYAGCWRWHRVWTPDGWRLHRINVCYYSSY
jgi:hypothetical protein